MVLLSIVSELIESSGFTLSPFMTVTSTLSEQYYKNRPQSLGEHEIEREKRFMYY